MASLEAENASMLQESLPTPQVELISSPFVLNEQQKSSSALSEAAADKPSKARKSKLQRPNYNLIHRYPLPVKTYALPPLIPNNPLSILHIAYTYIRQLISPPPSHPSPLYVGVFSQSTHSVHVIDASTIRALWEMGFFGKGSLSRSEPNWLESEKRRRGFVVFETAEEARSKRRAERRQFKEERARTEQRAIDEEMRRTGLRDEVSIDVDAATANVETESTTDDNNHVQDSTMMLEPLNDLEAAVPVIPSPSLSAPFPIQTTSISPAPSPPSSNSGLDEPVNQEHLQLSLEESLFLVYGLGVLSILHPVTHLPIPKSSLLGIFRSFSSFPPSTVSHNRPDDAFMLSYVAYHHFRSLGWVVRPGIKFSVDWLLYNRGPAFSHAEFAVIVLPSYTNEYYKNTETGRLMVKQGRSGKDWWWLHCVNRVQAQVKKSLILCYVDIPPPDETDGSEKIEDIGSVLGRYSVKELIIKRWVPSRNMKASREGK